MKISLKSTILVICFSIVAVIAYQFYWLHNLYSASKNELNVNIYNAMKLADVREIQLRIKILEDNPDKKGEMTISAGVSQNEGFVAKSKMQATMTNDSGVVEERKANNILNEDSTKGLTFEETMLNGELLFAYMVKGIHQALDNIQLPNIHDYDSLLTVELKNYGIEKTHYVEFVDVKADSIVSTNRPEALSISGSDMKRFDYKLGDGNQYDYRLYIKNPNSQVVKQMTGILTASGIVLMLLIWLFYYLMRTIWRQKELEAMKNDFINNMTHEFKTPLSVSYAAIDSLLVTEKANDKGHRDKYLHIAKDQITHLTGLVEQILSMSRENKRNIEMNHEKIELESIIRSIARQQILAAKKTIEFDIRINPSGLIVFFDRMHLANILNNLIENSIKYSGDPVKISVSACYGNKNEIQISVEDNGIGIDPEKQKYVFDKFYRVPTGDRHNVKGYGLGLFYVKEMIEKNGGSVRLKSKPGKGSVFTIILKN